MTQNRRPGFRLPWTSDEEVSATASTPATDRPADEAPEASSPSPEGNGTTHEAAASDATTAQADASDASAAAEQPGSAAPMTESPGAASTDVAAPVAAAPDAGAETEFMRDLVAAMRGVADEARRATTADVQARAEAQVQQLDADSQRRRAELQAKADTDVAGVGQWAEAEAERIRAEAEQRVSARRTQLEEQLAAEAHRGEAETRAVRDRLAEYERELDAYHAQLTEITDPAAFAAAAKRMPAPPSFEAAAANAPVAPPAERAPEPIPAPQPAAESESDDEPVAASEVDEAAAAEEASPEEPAPALAAEPSATEDSATEGSATEAPVTGTGTDERETAEAVTEATGSIPAAMAELMPADQNGAEPAVEPSTDNGTLAQRLAHLRAEAAGGTTTTEAERAAPGESVTTEVVVRGLGSFGAITGFRQSLSNVDGIDGVSLSLGQSGEFVFRATHAPGFDVAAAIVSLEGDKAQVESTPAGGLHVTLERAR